MERAPQKVGILVAVEPASLLRIVEHVLQRRPEFQIVAKTNRGSALVQQARRLQPKLIIANLRMLGEEAGRIIPEVKLASPRSMLIVTGFPQGLGRHAHKCGADAYLEEEQLVRRLVPTAQKMLRQRPHATRPRTTLTGSISVRPSKGRPPLLNPSRSCGSRAKSRLKKIAP